MKDNYTDMPVEWNIEKARELYGLPFWGEGYFDVDERGRVRAHPRRSPGGIDLFGLSQALRRRGFSLPVLVRFLDILKDRVEVLKGAFGRAMGEDGYRGGYVPIYPIKVNQQRRVVEALLEGGVGLEAGSKPELLAVLALIPPGGIVIGNGYKDREYLRLALMGQRLGAEVYVVIEKPGELALLIEEAERLGVDPCLGLRVRLSAIGGKWQNTGGEKAKFGLTAADALDIVRQLREGGRLSWLRLLHFHMGSQIANIRDIQRGLREGARYYAELRRLGADIGVVDVGGGLGVDYEGTRSRGPCSMNYTVEEYAKAVVHTLWEVCREEGLPHPRILTEAGRAMTAHHALLITEVIDAEARMPRNLSPPSPRDPQILRDLWGAWEGLSRRRSPVEVYHEAAHAMNEAQTLFTHGLLTLEGRARAEELYLAVCHGVKARLIPGSRSHREVLDELNERLADKMFCNFSVFQSMPDVWGIDQVFPILPLHRLEEPPGQRAVIHDLTCDSDGCIKSYPDGEATLPLHPFEKGRPYVLGMFMLGAYQEILGDMHNLFGDARSVNVVMEGEGYRLEDPLPGDTVRDVLSAVHFEGRALMERYREKVQAAGLPAEEGRRCLEAFAEGLEGYTYLEEA